MTCGTCKHFSPRSVASISADGECTWMHGPFWLAGVLGPAPAYVDRTDGDGCKAWAGQSAPISKTKTYIREGV
jgi:hypothetical protein